MIKVRRAKIHPEDFKLVGDQGYRNGTCRWPAGLSIHKPSVFRVFGREPVPFSKVSMIRKLRLIENSLAKD